MPKDPAVQPRPDHYTFDTMSRNENWPQLILHYRTRHGLTQTQFAESLKVTQQTVSRWESGKQTPDPEAQQLLRSVIGLTALATKSAWRERVALSCGVEALFEKGWRCLATSERLHSIAGISQSALEGKTLAELPAPRNYAELLDKTPFFEGGVRVLKARAELTADHDCFVGQIDFWPVLTSGDEIVAHAVAHPAPAPAPSAHPQLVRFFDIRAIMIDGTVIKLEDDNAS
jgi:transcriptional regulator with XRE-family HTH domain